jgi:DNA topoisomerase-1
VRELIPHRSEIDSKYHFLLDAPTEDSEGNPTIVRYSRKMGYQYVMTEVDGKATGWQAHYIGIFDFNALQLRHRHRIHFRRRRLATP